MVISLVNTKLYRFRAKKNTPKGVFFEKYEVEK